jgi:hypothetical protein
MDKRDIELLERGRARTREDDQEECETEDRLVRGTEPENHGDLHFRCISIPSHPPNERQLAEPDLLVARTKSRNGGWPGQSSQEQARLALHD